MIRKKLARAIKYGAAHHPLRGRIYPARVRLTVGLKARLVPVANLLFGDVNGIAANHYARVLGQPLRPSTPVARFPHVALLEQYREMGDRVFEPEIFRRTAYYRDAAESLDITGTYFGLRSPGRIVDIARKFVENHSRIAGSEDRDGWGRCIRSVPPFPIRVRRVRHSDCYQIIDGHHRVSTCHLLGKPEVLAVTESTPVSTPLQSLLLDVLWLKGAVRLYQPVDAPELRTWPLVRRCADRLEKIRAFLQEHRLAGPAGGTSLDIGSSYGWFVAEMGKMGFDAFGVERDPIAASVGPLVYGTSPTQIFRSDIKRFFEEDHRRFDVVTCFSVLHHYAVGHGNMAPEELIRKVDRATGKVLFLDTGQNHEEWFREWLPQWDTDYIEAWLRKNTSFSHVRRLGVDRDAVPPNERNYSRMLFACVR